MGSSEKKLFLIPCYSTKNRGGYSPAPATEPLRTLVSKVSIGVRVQMPGNGSDARQ